ncbi:MAG: TonB-dependent receptor, partial [Gemmobacter sp.]|nr:TonB-dependent receptor [Gemmobacter sp.]
MKTSGVSLIALALATPLATAQTAAAQDTVLDEIVITANLIPTAANRTGVSVSVVTAEDLERAGDQMLSTYLARLPGVGVVQSGPAGTAASLRIRGAEPRYVAVYVDGVRVDDPTSIATEFDFGALSTADIGRVEILRGSQSALYGGSAVGGVVNITTRAAQKDGFSQQVAVEAGTNATLSGRYSLGFRDDRLQTALTISHHRSDGFSAYDTLPRTAGLEDDGIESTRLGFSARYQATDTLAIGASVFTQRTSSDYDGFLSDADNTQDRRETGGRVFAELTTGATDHVFEITQYDITRENFSAGVSTGDFTGARVGFGYQGATRLSSEVTLVYGADTMREKAVTAAAPGGKSTRISGVFVQGLWAPRDDLDLSVSARRDHNSGYGNFNSGRIAMAWRASDAVTLRAAVARGFRAPSLYEQFGDPRFGIGPNAGVGPETSRSFEMGTDLTLSGGVTVSATLFRIDVSNAIDYCGAWAAACATGPAAGFTNQYENVAGTSTRQGVELGASIPLGDRLTLGTGYTYTDARRPSGARLARVPRHDLTVSLDGDVTDRLQAGVSLQHVAGRPDDGSPAITMGSYSVVSARMSYALNDS